MTNEVCHYSCDFLMVCLVYVGIWDFICTSELEKGLWVMSNN